MTARGKTKKTHRFSWDAVPAEVTRALLVAAYDHAGQGSEVDKLEATADVKLPSIASQVLGVAGIGRRHFEACVPVLRSRWLPLQDVEPLREFAQLVQIGVRGEDYGAPLRNKEEVLAFLGRRRAGTTFVENLIKFFKRMNKVEVVVESIPSSGGGTVMETVVLVGHGEPDPRRPYPHQRQAWRRLEELSGSRGGAGLLVLPTGAGKTYTAVAWLTKRLGADAGLRVLWVADRQELVEQAADAFHDQAATLPRDEERRLKVVHADASPATALGDLRIDIVCTTRQSLIGRGFHDAARRRLATFLERPTIVVIDEAHHAVARTYRELLGFIRQSAPATMVIGLTATPWPSGAGMTSLLRKTFPETIVDVHVRDLVRSGVLATPVYHTVDSGEYLTLSEEEIRDIAGRDVPPAVLRRLDLHSRNQLVVEAWQRNQEAWGKTLVFACDIEHADHLSENFLNAGVQTMMVHSRSEGPRREVLDRFRRSRGPAVLISVGMLLEGVDIPDARTAFLTRPTTSRIVMRQMIGRVLRGEAAGGESVAHVVDIRDRWGADVDILAPIEIPLADAPHKADENGYQLPPVPDELTGEPIGEDILRRIERAYEELRLRETGPMALGTTTLVGFYELSDINVPVFDHCRDRWDHLITATLENRKLEVRSPIDLFGDLPIPRPSKADVDEIVAFCRSNEVAPPLVPVKATISPRTIAQQIFDGPALTESQKLAVIRTAWESSLARAAFSTFHAFYEAVNQELFRLADVDEAINAEAPTVNAGRQGRPKLRHDPARDLDALFHATITHARDLIANEAPDYSELLHTTRLPACEWTRNPVKSTFAYWTPRISGRSKGKPVIRVNSLLQAPSSQVSDEAIEYLIWHELCHHLLPGRGHDSEFRRLESSWPSFAKLDNELDTLNERYDLGWTN